MGKRRGKKKKRRVHGERQRRKGHESGPETAAGRERRDVAHEDSCSPAWNSLDEESLADYAENAAAGESGEEVEVAKLLSFLNFSVIPCALEPYNLECEPHAPSGGGPPTDVDLLSELTSATYLEREDGREGEAGDGRGKRASRKRASRRRPNKRTKKLRSSGHRGPGLAAAPGDLMCLCHFVRAGGEQREVEEEEEEEVERNGPSTAVSPRNGAANMNSSGYCERCYRRGGGCGRGKTARRKSRGERFDPLARTAAVGRWNQGKSKGTRSESSTPVNLPMQTVAQQYLVEMECENGDFSTDTSPTGEVDMGAEPEDSDHTPPADPSPGDSYEGERVEEEEEESELSDTTTDRWAIHYLSLTLTLSSLQWL